MYEEGDKLELYVYGLDVSQMLLFNRELRRLLEEKGIISPKTAEKPTETDQKKAPE